MDIRSGDMRAEGAASYPGSMDRSMSSERAALVALFRTRPEGMRWPEMTAEVLEAVAEHEQLSILRQVPAGYQDSEAEYPAN